MEALGQWQGGPSKAGDTSLVPVWCQAGREHPALPPVTSCSGHRTSCRAGEGIYLSLRPKVVLEKFLWLWLRVHHTEPAELPVPLVIWGPLGPVKVFPQRGLPTALSSSLHKVKDTNKLLPPSISSCLHADPSERAAGPWHVTTSACACPPSPEVTLWLWLVASKPPNYDTLGDSSSVLGSAPIHREWPFPH